jgi:hypothetical protein
MPANKGSKSFTSAINCKPVLFLIQNFKKHFMSDNSLRNGTIGGTLCSMLSILPWHDIGKTILLTAIGATISFLVSFGLRILFTKGKKRLVIEDQNQDI